MAAAVTQRSCVAPQHAVAASVRFVRAPSVWLFRVKRTGQLAPVRAVKCYARSRVPHAKARMLVMRSGARALADFAA
jgi:hypothetical protein